MQGRLSIGQEVSVRGTMTLDRYLQEITQGDGLSRHALLMQLSGLSEEEMEQFRRWWPSLHAERRCKLMERLVSVAEDNVDLDFNAIFRHCLADADPQVRERAVSGLWECDDGNLVGPLISLLKDDTSEQVRASAAMALGKFGSLAEVGKLLPRDGERIKEVLLAVLEDEWESVEVRRRALEAAACFNTPRIRELIRWAYNSPEPRLCISALYAMGRTGDPTWLPTLIKEMESKDSAMRYEAASACAEMMEEETVPYLIPLIQDDDLQVQLSAIRSLGAIGGSLAKRAIRQCLKYDDEVLQEAAQEALQQLEVEEAPMEFNF